MCWAGPVAAFSVLPVRSCVRAFVARGVSVLPFAPETPGFPGPVCRQPTFRAPRQPIVLAR
eukprot:4437686-Lingulodinium_polyedra.AAC.1